ncbi:MAG: hypothetical protein CMO01_13090 [Thalassobius sp.]|nr:hypothetical protein [Thalassovita sp.]
MEGIKKGNSKELPDLILHDCIRSSIDTPKGASNKYLENIIEGQFWIGFIVLYATSTVPYVNESKKTYINL